jgi:hypothetical protein
MKPLLVCLQCEKPIITRGATKFCSQRCKGLYERTTITANCEICNKEFTHICSRAKKAKYCSRKCYYKAMQSVGSVILECDVCGKTYRRPPSHSHYKNKTCSLKCRGIASRIEVSTAKSFLTVKSWMKRHGLIKSCEHCGYSEIPAILIVHHRDRDRTNNELSNLVVLCPNCHAIEHLSENKDGWYREPTKLPSFKRRSIL